MIARRAGVAFQSETGDYEMIMMFPISKGDGPPDREKRNLRGGPGLHENGAKPGGFAPFKNFASFKVSASRSIAARRGAHHVGAERRPTDPEEIDRSVAGVAAGARV